MSEVAADPVGQLGEPAHVADDGALKFGLAAGRRLAGHGVLQVGVQALDRVVMVTLCCWFVLRYRSVSPTRCAVSLPAPIAL